MVRSYLIENRICFGGDGGSGGGSSDNGDNQSSERRADDNGRPLAGGTTNLIDTSRQSRPQRQEPDRDPVVDIITMGRDIEPVRVDQTTEREFQDFARTDPVLNPGFGLSNQGGGGSGDAAAAANVEALVRAAAQPAAAAPAPPVANTQADLARQLINQAAQESLANPDRPTPRDSVDRAPGRNDPMSGFFAEAYDELYDGTPPGTGLATIFSGGPLGALTNSPDPADAQAFNVGQLMSMGGVRNPETGAITGAQAGRGTLNMNSLGMITYTGVNDPNYEGPFANLVRGTAGQNMSGGDDGGSSQPVSQPPATVDPGTTTPEVIDDLASNYLLNPYYLYSGRGNLYQPYGYAGGTLVDLLQTRGMTQPQQAAPTLNIFGNPRDFA